ncbi:MAG: FixH family protein [Gemmatimonadaceae bacterium]|nr:FixH family protein [Gemmatimonadaceae bacterium]
MKKGLQWPIGVAVVLALAVLANVYIAIRANDDPSVHIERDYYQKAVRFDADQALRQRSERLGWRVALDARRTSPAEAEVSATLTDSSGAPVRGAVLRLAAHAVARANDVFTVTAVEANGRYIAAVPVNRGGLWDFDVEAVRGSDRFVITQRLDLPDAPK